MFEFNNKEDSSDNDDVDGGDYEEFRDVMKKVKDKLYEQLENDRGKADYSKRKSDKDMWESVKSRTIGEILAQPCNSNCSCGGKCMFKVCREFLDKINNIYN